MQPESSSQLRDAFRQSSRRHLGAQTHRASLDGSLQASVQRSQIAPTTLGHDNAPGFLMGAVLAQHSSKKLTK